MITGVPQKAGRKQDWSLIISSRSLCAAEKSQVGSPGFTNTVFGRIGEVYRERVLWGTEAYA